MKSNKRYFYQIPSHVAMFEAAALYEFMATGETAKTEYLDKRHQCIFNNLEYLMQQIGRCRTQELIQYLSDQKLLHTAGGADYVEPFLTPFAYNLHLCVL